MKTAVKVRRVSDSEPGIRRSGKAPNFVYRDARGRRIRSRREIARIEAIVIPPAWRSVWICPSANGHLQATGRDARGRKQYRYHVRWRARRERRKFAELPTLARLLPRIRRRVSRDLGKRGLCRERVLAAMIAVLDATRIRVGNDEYRRDNRSYGLTTLRCRHVTIAGTRVRFRFRGKAGKQQEVEVRDARVAAVVRECRQVRGGGLFRYRDEAGSAHTLRAADVNAYLREASGSDVTTKMFRTLAGTKMARAALARAPDPKSVTEAKRTVREVVSTVAERLGNTPAVSRASYIDPQIVDEYLTATPTSVRGST